jgi:hypothetical protein
MPVFDSSGMLRIAVFSGFIGFVVFSGSYAMHVWLRRNKGNRSAASRVMRVGTILAVAGLTGVGGSWALNRFVDRSGIVDGDALFVVHARRDGNVRMTTLQNVSQGDVTAEFHPPAIDAQLRVIDSQVREAQARIETLRVHPLAIDPVLLQREERLSGQIAQQQRFQFEFMRSHRELERAKLDLVAGWEKGRNQIVNEIAAARTALGGLPPQLDIAVGQLGRADELRKHALVSAQVVDDRTSAMLVLNLEHSKLETTIFGLATRLALLDDQQKRATPVIGDQLAATERNSAATARSLNSLQAELADFYKQIDADRSRALMLHNNEIKVAQRQVDTLVAERSRAVAAQQIIAPFAGRVVYRNASPDLVPDGAPVLAVSAGSGFEAKILMSTAEIQGVAAAGTVRFALEHPVLTKYFSGKFRKTDETSMEPGRIVAAFDAQLPQDAIGLLGNGGGVNL